MTAQEYYAATGYFFMGSIDRLAMGQLERNDWEEDEMTEHRWAVVGSATCEDVIRQNVALGFTNKVDPRFRYFYRVVALD